MPRSLLPLWAPAPRATEPAHHNVSVDSYAQYVPTLTAAWRVNAAVSKAVWWPWPLTLEVVTESRVTWATSVPILVLLGLSVLDLDVRDRQTAVRQHHRLMPPPTRSGGIIISPQIYANFTTINRQLFDSVQSSARWHKSEAMIIICIFNRGM